MVKIIAELSINHLGMRKIAQIMIEECADMGVDYIKFKKKNVSSYYKDGRKYRGYDFKKYRGSFELSDSDFTFLDGVCTDNNIEWFSTIHDNEGFQFISSFNVPFYKVASSDALDRGFMEWFVEANEERKPMIVSTGGMGLKETLEIVELVKSHNIPLIINHCVSIYPTPIEQTNIGFIKELQKISEITVGYSGHERGWVPTLLAVQLGAKFVERHVALTRDINIHHIDASLTIEEFRNMVYDIRDLEKALKGKYRGREEEELSFLRDKVYK